MPFTQAHHTVLPLDYSIREIEQPLPFFLNSFRNCFLKMFCIGRWKWLRLQHNTPNSQFRNSNQSAFVRIPGYYFALLNKRSQIGWIQWRSQEYFPHAFSCIEMCNIQPRLMCQIVFMTSHGNTSVRKLKLGIIPNTGTSNPLGVSINQQPTTFVLIERIVTDLAFHKRPVCCGTFLDLFHWLR